LFPLSTRAQTIHGHLSLSKLNFNTNLRFICTNSDVEDESFIGFHTSATPERREAATRLIGLLDPLWCLWDQNQQCVHDLAASTIVVQD